MLIANPLDRPLGDCSTGLPTLLDPDVSSMLLLAGADRASNLSSSVSYQAAADGTDTLDITEKIRHVLFFLHHSLSRPPSARSSREANLR